MWVHYTTSCNTQSSAPEDGQNNCPKHAELTGIINKPLLLHLVGCLYYLYQRCTVKQISDNEIHLLIKYIKSVFRRLAKRLSYIEDAWCLKVKPVCLFCSCRPFMSVLNIGQIRKQCDHSGEEVTSVNSRVTRFADTTYEAVTSETTISLYPVPLRL